jgi:hypothetical protein
MHHINKRDRQRSIPPGDIYDSSAPIDLTECGLSATTSNRIPNPRDDPINHDDLLSPASVLSQRLTEHALTGQSKRAPWPNILSRLREAFSLDPKAAHEERDMVAMQAVSYTHPIWKTCK